MASSLAVGSGAFTSVSAQRSVAVEVAQDDQALLGLQDLGAGNGAFGAGRSDENADSKIAFQFPGAGQDEELGLGVDSVYEFDKDSAEPGFEDPEHGLFQIMNQGTQPVEVFSRHQTDSNLEIELYDVADSDKEALRDSLPVLDEGDSINVGFRIRTFGVVPGEFNETLTLIAEVPENPG